MGVHSLGLQNAVHKAFSPIYAVQLQSTNLMYFLSSHNSVSQGIVVAGILRAVHLFIVL